MTSIDDRYRVVGYDPSRFGSAVWLTSEKGVSVDVGRAAEFESLIVAERRAAELFTERHMGLNWMPVPASETDLTAIQSDHRKPWRD